MTSASRTESTWPHAEFSGVATMLAGDLHRCVGVVGGRGVSSPGAVKQRTFGADQVRRPVYASSVGRAERFGVLLEPLRVAREGVK